jgi:putative membrane protein
VPTARGAGRSIRDVTEREPGVEDASRRTRLASERTYLAWWRTGMTALAVAVGVGRLTPALTHGARWPYEVVGTGFGLLGVAFIVAAYARSRAVETALDRGGYARLPDSLSLALTLAGLALGAATVLLLLLTP